jgi:hypothetical protein
VRRHVMYTIVDRYDNERETWSKLTCHKHYLLVYSCLLIFLSREKNSYHNHRVLLLLILYPQHATKRKHRSDSVLLAYKINCYIFLYQLRSLRNTACARLLLCYIPSRNITISELTICIKPKITNLKLKDHVKSVLRISCAHNKINKWGPRI